MAKMTGKVAIVTGGARGIGSATVRLFVQEGARVLIADIQDQKGELLVNRSSVPVFRRTSLPRHFGWRATIRASSTVTRLLSMGA